MLKEPIMYLQVDLQFYINKNISSFVKSLLFLEAIIFIMTEKLQIFWGLGF